MRKMPKHGRLDGGITGLMLAALLWPAAAQADDERRATPPLAPITLDDAALDRVNGAHQAVWVIDTTTTPWTIARVQVGNWWQPPHYHCLVVNGFAFPGC